MSLRQKQIKKTKGSLRTLVFLPLLNVPTETFVRDHIEKLPGEVIAVTGRTPSFYYSLVYALYRSPLYLLRLFARVCVRFLPPHLGYKDEDLLAEELIDARPDVVLAEFGSSGIQLLRLCQEARLPLVVHFHGHDASAEEAISNDVYRPLFEYASSLIVVSKVMAKALQRLGASTKKIQLIPYGVSIEKYRNRTFPETRRFLTVGRFVEKKGMLQALRAFHRLLGKYPHATLTMIGEGPLRPSCERFVAAHGLQGKVHFLGECTHEDVLVAYRNADCFLQHSVRASNGDSEGQPVAILEAAAAGLPIISTRHAGIPEAIKHNKAGFLVAEHDVEGMARAMEILFTDPKRALGWGKAAHAHIKKYYSQEVQIRQLNASLEAAATRSPKKRAA